MRVEDHPILGKIRDSSDEDFIEKVSVVLLDQALLVSGAELKNPVEFVKKLNELLSK